MLKPDSRSTPLMRSSPDLPAACTETASSESINVDTMTWAVGLTLGILLSCTQLKESADANKPFLQLDVSCVTHLCEP
ncbi:hypothetical protein PviCFBP13515_18210 [Pseudomonas viridiflava]|nr:hypothetical protein PviCFBP13507_22315 [Pseudomonas viridiflava]TKK24963.1 hypothetical protein PviCFBP13515_18210 [Pseudomonas viridiflava]